MTREEAIIDLNALKFILNDDQYTDEIEEALDMAIEALQQPDHIVDGGKKGDHLREVTKMMDTISRQAAIEVIDAVFPVDPMKSEYAQGIACGAALAKTYVEQLPPVQPEQRWIPVTERLPEEDNWLGCSWGQFSSDVLVSILNSDDEDAWIDISHTIDGEWALELPRYCEIIAWIPLPAPYRKEGEEG